MEGYTSAGNDTYECARCHGVFEKVWSDEEAAAEMEATWQPQPGPLAVICDDCYQQMMAWARRDAPEILR